jgi:hypothetical protein
MDNRSFWNHRYVTLPQLGSGPGSRGYAADYKNKLIHARIQSGGIHSIFDIGCGDLCWLDDDILLSCAYSGFDISEVVIAKNSALHPSVRFTVHDITIAPLGATADLVVSFDLLIHQVEQSMFSAALTNILAAIGKVGFLSYRTPPLANEHFPKTASLDRAHASAAAIALEEQFIRMMSEELPSDCPTMETAFHGALPELIRLVREDMEARDIGQYRNQTIYEVRPRN